MTDAELGASIRAIAKEAFEYGMRRFKTEWLAFGPLPATHPVTTQAQTAPPPAAVPQATRPLDLRHPQCDTCGGFGFTFKQGVSKTNNRPYSGNYCNTQGCKGKPVAA